MAATSPPFLALSSIPPFLPSILAHGDMVKCELRVANASCELLMFCELRVTSCTCCASYVLRVALIVRVTSCELNERCELETQKCELKPKVRVACFLL